MYHRMSRVNRALPSSAEVTFVIGIVTNLRRIMLSLPALNLF
jgi:hypothetical protein